MASKFFDAVREFRSVQERYSEFGAADTEPSTVFAQLIKSVYDGHNPVVSLATPWQLFDWKPGSGEAHAALTTAASNAVDAAVDDPINVQFFDERWRW